MCLLSRWPVACPSVVSALPGRCIACPQHGSMCQAPWRCGRTDYNYFYKFPWAHVAWNRYYFSFEVEWYLLLFLHIIGILNIIIPLVHMRMYICLYVYICKWSHFKDLGKTHWCWILQHHLFWKTNVSRKTTASKDIILANMGLMITFFCRPKSCH